MNVFDKNLLFDMSYALMRRFAFIEVGAPSDEAYERAARGPRRHRARAAAACGSFRDLGPAVYLDAAKYAARRAEDGPTESRLLYEVFYAYFLPQFEGIDDEQAVACCTSRSPSSSTPPSRPRPSAPSARCSASPSRSDADVRAPHEPGDRLWRCSSTAWPAPTTRAG